MDLPAEAHGKPCTRRTTYLKSIKELTARSVGVEYCPDLMNGLDWLNTSHAISIKNHLRGKIVVLDFFTYCCINCLHILPDLHALEEQYSTEQGLVIVGIHSAKFTNEKASSNIRNAILRYGITHPVVNDHEASLWNQLQIQCWPTLVILGPAGQILTRFVGEGHKEELFDFVSAALEAFAESLNHSKLPFLTGYEVASKALVFPGKVTCLGEDLIISDSGNHRVVICDREGSVKVVVGTGESGTVDGDYKSCQFMSPQGLCCINGCLYVADPDANAVRKVDMAKRYVSTVAGTGVLGTDKEGGVTSSQQPLSSPWDVKACCSIGSTEEDMLLIAMAGAHQIWALFLKDGKWWKSSHTAMTCLAIAGSGAEENRNNSYPHKAAFAQPSGLSLDDLKRTLYVADSESSTIRQISLTDGSVKGLVGGARDPTDLFAFGDQDGMGGEAKLQHPLDVVHIPGTDFLIVCDSYNHKLKLVNVATRKVSTLPVSGLNEPSGLCYEADNRRLYVADTNNHCIKYLELPADLADVEQLRVEEMTIIHGCQVDSNPKPLFDHSNKSVVWVTNPSRQLRCGTHTLTYHVDMDTSAYLNPDITSAWRATLKGERTTGVKMDRTQGTVTADTLGVSVQVTVDDSVSPSSLELELELQLFFCSNSDGVCSRRCMLVLYPLTVG